METTGEEDNPEESVSQRNFIVLIVYNVFVRIGWVFKTESIVMPAIMDSIAGSGWLRGCLPMLNRLGQSIPPMLLSDWVRRVGQKKWVAVTCLTAMGSCFLLLAAIWSVLDGDVPKWLPAIFLIVYSLFWFCVGLHNLSISLLYGKLVNANLRGRLLLIATSIGAVIAVLSAWFLMRDWLSEGSGKFNLLFLFTGILFVTASLVGLTLAEKSDDDGKPITRKPLTEIFSSALLILKTDRNFRLLALIAVCFGASITLFPHYQAYAKQSLQLDLKALVSWVIAQNIGAAFFSIPLGYFADKFGNRLAIRCAMFLLCIAPILTIVMVYFPTKNPEVGFYAVFFLLGLMPVTMRIFNNYTLEIANRDQQPIYLSTLGASMALPVVLLSTIVGAMADIVSFEAVFTIVVSIVFIGWTLTFRLLEPRHNPPPSPAISPESNES